MGLGLGVCVWGGGGGGGLSESITTPPICADNWKRYWFNLKAEMTRQYTTPWKFGCVDVYP